MFRAEREPRDAEREGGIREGAATTSLHTCQKPWAPLRSMGGREPSEDTNPLLITSF